MVQSDGLVIVFSSDYISASLSNTVSGDTNLLSDDHKVPQCQTPPSRCQNRIAKYCQRKIFHINPMLKTVDEKKRKKPKSDHWRSTRCLHKTYTELF